MPVHLFKIQRLHVRPGTGRGSGYGCPPLVFGGPLPAVYLRVFGVTKDSTGAALGSCDVHLFRALDDLEMDQTTSDGSGNYEFRSAGLSETYYVVAYKAGAPDVAGTTLNTLVGA